MAVAVAGLVLWVVLGVALLWRKDLDRPCFWLCAAALALGAAVRLASMDHVTSDYTDFLSQWVQFFRDNGGFGGIRLSVGDYNVPYLYLLAAISYFPVSDLYLIKLISIFFDLVLAFGAARLTILAFPGRGRAAAVVFSAVVLLPTVALNGACWGQCDSVYGALTLLALADALDRHPARSVIWLGVAFSFKLQAIFLIPLWCVLWYARRVRFKHLLLFPAAYLATILPALALGKPLGDILGVYFNQMGLYHDRLTLNAPSLFALIPYGAEVDGPFWAKVGIFAAFALVLALLGALFFVRKRLTNAHLLAAGLVLAIGVPLLLPYMHERYFFLAELLSVVWAAGGIRRGPVPVCVQIAALGGYHAYLTLRYAFPMAWGAWLMALSLAAVLGSLVGQLLPPRQQKTPEPS